MLYFVQRELAAWIYPEGYDPSHAEASHLIHHADSDKVIYQ